MSVWRTAYAMASRGIPVFPCAQGAKQPLTARGFHDASTDPRTVAGWSSRWTSANLAIPTGFRSGLFVLDIDRKAVDGLESVAQAERELGALPNTLTARTPSGGEHRYFQMPSYPLRNSASKLGPGVDTRGEGGYVLVPPSVIGGGAYRWLVRAQSSELPPAWVDALKPCERASAQVQPWSPRDDREQSRADSWCTRALQEEARELAAAPAGTRNDRLWRSAAALGGLVHMGAIDAADIRRALAWACSQWPQRTPHKDASTLENGLAFGLAHPREIRLGDDNRAA